MKDSVSDQGIKLLIQLRNRHLLVLDLVLLSLAAALSFALRYEGAIPATGITMLLVFAAAAIVIKPVVFYGMGLYRCFWRSATVNDLLLIVLSSTAATFGLGLILLPLLYVLGLQGFPRSVVIIDWLLSLCFVGGSRFSIRWWAQTLGRRRRLGRSRLLPKRVLVMGAGHEGIAIVKEMRDSPQLGLLPVGFLDDDPHKQGLRICGLPVLGGHAHIPRLAQKYKADELIIAMPSAAGKVIREIIRVCSETQLPSRTVPGMAELLSAPVNLQQLRQVNIEDLLRRDPVQTDLAGIRAMIEDKCVLVTGAGGSIGSELCRKIARFAPARLLLLGHGENSIFGIEQELRRLYPALELCPLIVDIRDRRRLAALWSRFEPQIVFHAAAHKHVPLMECNIEEAVTNNVLGTLNLVELSAANGVQRFVLISSDKAVRPSSVMGVTKRIAELIVQSTAEKAGKDFAVVRFGNVLGSRGSVVHTFRAQIAAGGPLTVTHPDMRRFFMSIPEAAQLVLQAATLGHGGEVFILDMGEQIRIQDLATDLCRLCGLEVGTDIDIVYTGIRPGEKLEEELFVSGEEYHPTRHTKILEVLNHRPPSYTQLQEQIDELIGAAQAGQVEQVVHWLHAIVPAYQSANPEPALSESEAKPALSWPLRADGKVDAAVASSPSWRAGKGEWEISALTPPRAESDEQPIVPYLPRSHCRVYPVPGLSHADD